MPGHPFRDAAKDCAIKPAPAVAPDHDQIGRPGSRSLHNRVHRVAHRGKSRRILGNGDARAKARQDSDIVSFSGPFSSGAATAIQAPSDISGPMT